MKSNTILITITLLIAIIAGVALTRGSSLTPNQAAITGNNETEAGTVQDEVVMEGDDGSPATADAMDKKDQGKYLTYTPSEFAKHTNKKRILFFSAAWCSTCKAANKDFLANLDKLPSDVVLFKTDYDSESALKKKYNITYQHTFVQVDANGELVATWNGGGITQLLKRVK